MFFCWRTFIIILALFTAHHIKAEEEEPEEEEQQTKAPETTTSRGHITDPCAVCVQLAADAKGQFDNHTWFRVYERDRIKNAYRKAGMKNCEELIWAYQCFEHCTEELKPGMVYSYPHQFQMLKRVIAKYCEVPWGNGQAGCRMADTVYCDTKYQKSVCGDNLKYYMECVDDTLQTSQQDCSGVCTPARRYHKILSYQWDLECKLTQSIDSKCRDYVTAYCFNELKDTELSWGIFENINTNSKYSDLDKFCPMAQDVITCMNETLTETVDFYTFKYNKPCASIRNNVIELMDMWEKIINPLCSERPNGTKYINEVCGSPPTTERIPSTTTQPPPSTTPLKTIRRKVLTRRNGDGLKVAGNQMLMLLGLTTTILVTVLFK